MVSNIHISSKPLLQIIWNFGALKEHLQLYVMNPQQELLTLHH